MQNIPKLPFFAPIMMKLFRMFFVLMVMGTWSSLNAQVEIPKAINELFIKHTCFTCHKSGAKLVGPSWEDIAARKMKMCIRDRPSVLLGQREEPRPMESFAAGAGLALRAMGPKIFSKITPIEAHKVALSMVKLAQETKSGVFYHSSDVLAKLGRK